MSPKVRSKQEFVPVTAARRDLPSHIEVEPGESGFDHPSYAKSDDVKSVSGGRLVERVGVTVHAVAPPESLSVETTAGGVGTTVPDVGYQIATDTTVGGIDVTVSQDPESDRSIAVEAAAGGISIAGG